MACKDLPNSFTSHGVLIGCTKDKTAKCSRKLHGMPEVSELSSEGLLMNNQREVPLHALNESLAEEVCKQQQVLCATLQCFNAVQSFS